MFAPLDPAQRAYSAGGGLEFGLNIVTTSGLHLGGRKATT